MCRKWSICVLTIVILALSKRLEIDNAVIYTIVAFAGGYIGIQGSADAAAAFSNRDRDKTPPPPV